jgi:aminoglycoside phosphotransferase
VSDLAGLLPEGLFAAVEVAAGVRITDVRPRGGGGASREGAELTLAFPDGRTVEAYMNYDVHRAGAGDDAAFLREAAILRALSGPLARSGVRAAPFIAAIPELRALVTEKMPGEAQFTLVREADRRCAIAADFMAQIATLHAIDVAQAAALGGSGTAREDIAARIATIRAANAAHGKSPLVHLALDWLEANVPAEPERAVIVHGDAGPGNFLYDGDRVIALLDWELVHIGDPMADLAMLCLRSLFQPLVPLPEAFAAYEAAGGAKIDLARVRYWRLLLQTGFVGRSRLDDPDAPPPPNLGMNMVYSMVHRRVLAEALAEASGVTLQPVALPEVPQGANARSFALALDDLRETIVPRLSDQQAAVKAKGMARLIKWWRDTERFGAAFATAELAELSQALETQFASVTEGRAALATAVVEGALDPAIALQLCHARVVRDTALMADAMGSFATTHFAPLEKG